MSQVVSDSVYEFIRSYQARYHIPPTIREIADGCHLGTTTVHYHLKRLQANRRIAFTKRKARSIVLVEETHQA
jgi:SOS-response transcriptional repressor LexA